MCGSSSSPAEKPTPPPTTNLEPVEPTEGTRMGRMKNYHRAKAQKNGATMLTGDM